MDLVFLHGPPATGQCTVGRELAALTGSEQIRPVEKILLR